MTMEPNVQPFKEPRGFIRLLQWLFAICAFATTVDYSGEFGFLLTCKENPNGSVKATGEVKYPFGLDRNTFSIINTPQNSLPCGTPQISLIGNAQSEAVFFVFTGVISFLYATFMIGVYLFADKIYIDNKRAPLADFFITVILAVFWIAGASAWAHGVSSLRSAMDVGDWYQCPTAYNCTGYFYDSTSKLVVSVLFGFINFVLWAGNIWFLYKETASILNGVVGGAPAAGGQTSPGGP